jgi:hypothetical protein
MNKPIISTWGLGPSYRDRVKHNLLKSLETGYDNTMDYIILTDVPEDFDELRSKTNKIIDVVNIHEVRDQYPYSKKIEYIPLDQENYGKEYRDLMNVGKDFSYALHRFSLPRIAELGYTKFVFQDPDVDIRYDKIVSGEITEELFWEQFNTPENSMKGCHKEHVGIDPGYEFRVASALGHSSESALQLSSILTYELSKKYPTNKSPIIIKLDVTEGPFRYYNFSSVDKLKTYFNVWNDAMNLSFSNDIFKNCNGCGGYMICDYIPVGVSNYINDITVLNFDPQFYKVNIYFTDRYFSPINYNFADGTNFIPSDTLEEFYSKNIEQIKTLKQQNRWPIF